jgi:hypothetical protein
MSDAVFEMPLLAQQRNNEVACISEIENRRSWRGGVKAHDRAAAYFAVDDIEQRVSVNQAAQFRFVQRRILQGGLSVQLARCSVISVNVGNSGRTAVKCDKKHKGQGQEGGGTISETRTLLSLINARRRGSSHAGELNRAGQDE